MVTMILRIRWSPGNLRVVNCIPIYPLTSQTLPNFVAPFFVNDALVDKINKAHSKMFGQSPTAVKTAYLEKVTVWPLSGASLFAVQVT
jgi:hypothetical protein